MIYVSEVDRKRTALAEEAARAFGWMAEPLHIDNASRAGGLRICRPRQHRDGAFAKEAFAYRPNESGGGGGN